MYFFHRHGFCFLCECGKKIKLKKLMTFTDTGSVLFAASFQTDVPSGPDTANRTKE